MMRAHRLRVVLALAAAALAPAPALSRPSTAPDRILERATGSSFESVRSIGGLGFECLGAGSRKTFGFKIYAVAFCLESGRAGEVIETFSKQSGRSGKALAESLAKDQRFFDALADAPGEKLIVLRFLRDIPGDRLSGAFLGSLGKVMPQGEAQKLANALTSDVAEGDTAYLASRNGEVLMSSGSISKIIPSPVAAERLWRVWLGSDSATPNLKESIASRAAGVR